MLYDFWMGRELNPRLPGVMWDLKEWCELYPGLIGWAVLNLCMAVRQYDLHGYGEDHFRSPNAPHSHTTRRGTRDRGQPHASHFQHRDGQDSKEAMHSKHLLAVSTSMVLVNVFQFIYVLDALYHEPAILTTMDITTDGFGFMLVFGDLAWVPFTYTTQARFLAANAVPLGAWGVLAITALNVVGYVTFRGSNSQKDAFRRDPKGPPGEHNSEPSSCSQKDAFRPQQALWCHATLSATAVRHLKTLETKTGRSLIISGWWGIARHINYTGDW